MDHAWSDFAAAALAAFDELAARCERVAIVGLSLGGGLGAYVAEERPDVAAIVFINAWVKPFAREMLEGLDALLEAGLETIDGVGGDVKRAGAVESSYRATPLASAKTVMAGLAPVHERLSSIAAPSLVFCQPRGPRHHLGQQRRPRGDALGARRAHLARGLLPRGHARQRPGVHRAHHGDLPAAVPRAMSEPLRREDVAKVGVTGAPDPERRGARPLHRAAGHVLAHAADMAALDLEGVEPTAHPFGLVNVVRADEVRASLERDAVLAQAPDDRGRPLRGAPDHRRGAVRSADRDRARRARRRLERHERAASVRWPSSPSATPTSTSSSTSTRPARAPPPTHVDELVANGRDPGPLAGVPVALKDNLCTGGVPTTCSSRILEGWRPPYNATVVERLLAGRARCRWARPTSTSSPWGPRPRTRPSARPATPTTPRGCPAGRRAARPPRWPPAMTPLALGSDTGGSIRQPAALCGRGRGEADLRAGLALRARRLRELARPDRALRRDRRRRRAAARGDRRPRPARLDVAARARPAPRRARRATGSRVGGSAWCASSSRAPTPTSAARGARSAADALRDAGATVVEVSVPELRLGLSRVLPHRPGRGVEQPGPLRRRALRAARRRRPTSPR